MHRVTWLCKPFADLSPYELYEILKMRNEIFVVEQNCVFQDVDDKDPLCYHLWAAVSEELAAYARLVPAGVSYPYVSIGRVITRASYRGSGLGKDLMGNAIAHCQRLYGEQTIKIGAQSYLKQFYQGFGFYQQGEPYLEDGIEHIEMIRYATGNPNEGL